MPRMNARPDTALEDGRSSPAPAPPDEAADDEVAADDDDDDDEGACCCCCCDICGPPAPPSMSEKMCTVPLSLEQARYVEAALKGSLA